MSADNKKVDLVYDLLIKDSIIKEIENTVIIKSLSKNENDKNKKIMDEIEKVYKDAKYDVPTYLEVLSSLNLQDTY